MGGAWVYDLSRIIYSEHFEIVSSKSILAHVNGCEVMVHANKEKVMMEYELQKFSFDKGNEFRLGRAVHYKRDPIKDLQQNDSLASPKNDFAYRLLHDSSAQQVQHNNAISLPNFHSIYNEVRQNIFEESD